MCILNKKERGDCVRMKRKLQWIYYRLYLFILLDNIKERIGCFPMHVAQIGWTTYIFVSLFLCVLCVFYVYVSTICYVFHCYVIYNFLTLIRDLSPWYFMCKCIGLYVDFMVVISLLFILIICWLWVCFMTNLMYGSHHILISNWKYNEYMT